jgi:hypothetical protein
MAVVLPLFTDKPDATPDWLSKDAVDTVDSVLVPDLRPCLSVDAYIAFISAEGMQDGVVPHRQDYSPTTYTGASTGHACPNNVTQLLVFYQEPLDIVGHARMRVAKTNLPALSIEQLDGGQINPTQVGFLQTVADHLQRGMVSDSDVGYYWYRGLAMPKPRNVSHNILRCTAQTVRGYVATQRRRLVPH